MPGRQRGPRLPRAWRRPWGSVSLARAVEGVVVGLRLVLAVVVVTDEIDATLDVRRIGSIPSRVGFVLSVCCRLLLVGVRSAGAAKGRVGVVDAAVDDSDLDALSGVASGPTGSLPYLRDAEGGHTGSVAALIHGDGVHGLHPGHGPERFQLVVVDGHAHPIEGGLHLPLDLSTLGLDGLGDLSLVTLQFAFYVLLLGLAERPSVFASVTATGSPWSSTMTVLLLWDSKNSCAASGLISPSGAGTARPPMPLSPPVSSAVATDTGRTSVRTPAVASSFLLRKVLPFLVRGTRTGPRRLPSLPPISVSPVRMGKQRRIAH